MVTTLTKMYSCAIFLCSIFQGLLDLYQFHFGLLRNGATPKQEFETTPSQVYFPVFRVAAVSFTRARKARDSWCFFFYLAPSISPEVFVRFSLVWKGATPSQVTFPLFDPVVQRKPLGSCVKYLKKLSRIQSRTEPAQ